MLRFFVTPTPLFTWIAVVLVVIFVVDILVIVVVFWGAVFGVGVIDPDPVCDVNMSAVTADGNLIYTFAKTAQYPPIRCTAYSSGGDCLSADYVANTCNLNQYAFNLCIKVQPRRRSRAAPHSARRLQA